MNLSLPIRTRIPSQLSSQRDGAAVVGHYARKRLLVLAPASHADFIFQLIPKSSVDRRFITDDDDDEDGGDGEDADDGQVSHRTTSQSRAKLNIRAAKLVEWADVLCLALVDAGTIGALIAGLTTNLTLTVLRGWDEDKPVVMVPRMSYMEWNSSITRRQMSLLADEFPWIHVMSPILTALKTPEGMIDLPWDGQRAFVGQLRYQLGLRSSEDYHRLDRDDDADEKASPSQPRENGESSSTQAHLPQELIFMIFEELNDWETAVAVGVDVKITTPVEWKPYIPQPTDPPSTPWSLAYTILQGSMEDIQTSLSTLPLSTPLPDLCARLIFKFSRTDILDYLVTTRMDIYDTTPALQQLPLYASSIYPNVRILRWWGRSRHLPLKVHNYEPVDSASRLGLVDVLEWWRTSGFPFCFTERALEGASGLGRLEVLDWWKNTAIDSTLPPIELQPGKSVALAAQTGCAESLVWWDSSGISYGHGDSVARIASNHGHVHVLSRWHQMKGTKMAFDNQVLVGATKNGHVDVLEWWKRSGLRVEFKTCDIEEALEDAVSGAEGRVRQWWAQYGLNLGVGMAEWLKVKVL